MHRKMLVICQSQNHLEKGLYLAKISPIPIEIACITFKPEQLSRDVLSTLKFYNSPGHIIPFIDQYEKFIFFNMAPSESLFKLILRIRKFKKNIVAIQETHQLGMHLGAVNSIIFSPDIILTASDFEKELFIEKKFFIEKDTISPGWLFQSQYQSFVKTLYQKSISSIHQEYVLVLLSAPNQITASSPETYAIRKAILKSVQERYQNVRILIKLHPLEQRKPFAKYIHKELLGNIDLAPQTDSLWGLVRNSQAFVTSNRTQAFIDLIENDKEMLVYELGGKNFISSYLNEHTKAYVRNDINFYPIRNAAKDLKIFKELHCKSDEMAKNYFINLMLQKNLPIDRKIYFEESAWAFIFGDPLQFKKFVEEIGLDPPLQIKNIFNLEQGIDYLKLSNELITLSSRAAISLVLIREIIAQNLIDKNNIKDFVEIFFTPHIIQYFYNDSIRFEFFLSHQKLHQYIQPESLNLLQATKLALAKKSNIVKSVFFMERIISKWKSIILRKIAYSLIDKIFILGKNLKN
jgi:hypothetical protein